MRFLMLLKASPESEAGILLTAERINAMSRYNESMIKAGVLLDAAGLQSSSSGVRVQFRGDQRTVVDGPFAASRELVSGFWMIQVKSRAEAVEWARRCPLSQPGGDFQIELRQVAEAADVPHGTIPCGPAGIPMQDRHDGARG